jgi:outer membrane protein OmpA-like peptidoglycan-associated protein
MAQIAHEPAKQERHNQGRNPTLDPMPAAIAELADADVELAAPPDSIGKVAVRQHAFPGDPRLMQRASTSQRASLMQQLQHRHGNAYISRRMQHMLQRKPDPADPDSTQQTLPTFDSSIFVLLGRKFDAIYLPGGPSPAMGELEIILNVAVELKDFDLTIMRQEPFKSYFRTHPLTREQRKDFAWPKEESERRQERQKFGSAFKSQVQSAWSGKHPLKLNDPAFSPYQCNVKITVNIMEDEHDADLAHNRIQAQKVPEGVEARFRSFVKGNTSVLDYRDPDPTKAQKTKVNPIKLVKQIGPFGFDEDTLTPSMEGQIAEVEGQLRQMAVPGKVPGTDGFLGEGVGVTITGRASARGSRTYNDKLSQRRIDTVHNRIGSDLGWGPFALTIARGEEHASEDERFQRVDIAVVTSDQAEVEQITAAHEAGHMFGLGDEYVDEKPTLKDAIPKFEGDEPTHFQDVKNLIDETAAKETIVHNSGSIMAQGSEVGRAHYVYFLQALNQMTEKRWTVE